MKQTLKQLILAGGLALGGFSGCEYFSKKEIPVESTTVDSTASNLSLEAEKIKRLSIIKERISEIDFNNPIECLIEGTALPDDVFFWISDKLAGSVSKSSLASYLAGADKGWSEERFNKYGALFAGAVSNDRLNSARSGLGWSDSRFNNYGNPIVETIVKIPLDAEVAGEAWSPKKFERYGEKLAQSVAGSPVASYLAGVDWSDERFYKYGKVFARAISKDCPARLEAKKGWPSDRFNQYKELLEITLSRKKQECLEYSIDQSIKNAESWRDNKSYLLNTMIKVGIEHMLETLRGESK